MSSLYRCLSILRINPLLSHQINHYYIPTTSSRYLSTTLIQYRKKQQKTKRIVQSNDFLNNDNLITSDISNLPRPQRISGTQQLKFYPKSNESNFPSIVLADNEKDVNIQMLKRVVKTLESNGYQFLLPWSDDYAIEKILGIMHEIVITTGLRIEFLVDSFIQKPELFSAMTNHGDQCVEVFDTLCDVCGFSIEDSIRIFASFTKELLEITTKEIQERLSLFIQSGLQGGYPIGHIVKKCPGILFGGNVNQMAQTIENLHNFFSRNEIKQILERIPQISMMNFEEIEAKYEYIYYHMGIEPSEFVTCNTWALKELNEIMDRHQFLVKTGKYTLPDPKRPQLKMENPLLYRILDTRDDNFAIQVARVTLDEWLVYKELAKKLRSLENKERPFERIKPSQRKAYERRLKEIQEKEEFVFE